MIESEADMQQDTIHILLVADDEADYILMRELLSEIEGTRFHLDWLATYADARLAILARRRRGWVSPCRSR